MKKLLLLPLLFALSMTNAQTYDPLEYATGNLNAQQQLLSYPLTTLPAWAYNESKLHLVRDRIFFRNATTWC
ncbi:MAG: hypothetical protein IPM91_18900 [Bacteroidetes bacterium]|nr:hypothetical protein [Bacteroidota bacterium]